MVACLIWALASCGGSGSTGPATGSLEVTAATTGANLDPDGYTVTVDGGAPQSLADNATLTVAQLSSGSHQVVLGGLAANCTASGSNPRSVAVSAGQTATTTFNVICTAPGAIEIITSTSGGNLDPDGYTVAVDAGAPQAIGDSDTITVSGLLAGNHQVTLAGLAANCSVTASNPRTVAVLSGATASTTFAVTCTLPGAIEIITATTGSDLDLDGYTVAVDASAPQAIGDSDSVTVSGLLAGNHQVALAGVATNCAVTGMNPRTVAVPSGGMTTTAFAVSCAAAPTTAGTIVFTRYHVGSYQSYTMKADGTGLTNISNNLFDDLYPRWSPDGTKIAFSSDSGGVVLIYVANADGTARTLTTSAWEGVEPAWSPNGTKIAFTSNIGHIVVMKADGSNPALITIGPYGDGDPAWSPDSSKIALASTRDPDGNWEIYVMNPDGSNPVRLTSTASTVQNYWPAWSPDGTKIAFHSNRDGDNEIFVMNADGSGVTQLTHNTADDVEPAWSPDGTAIIFRSNRLESATYSLFVMYADGSVQTQLTHPVTNDSDRTPDWKR